MAICELVAEGKITDNRIRQTEELEEKFKGMWKVYVDSDEIVHYDTVTKELFGGE